jgi:hypothetical protein
MKLGRVCPTYSWLLRLSVFAAINELPIPKVQQSVSIGPDDGDCMGKRAGAAVGGA